jgi:hypothetical protein
MSQNPAGLLANIAKHNFERRSQIAGRRNLHRDCLEQAELLFTFAAILFCALTEMSFFTIAAHK